MHDVFGITLSLLAAITITSFTARIKYLPKVTIFLLIGILFGPSVLNLLKIQAIDDLFILKEFAHGIMIFIIGQEFTLTQIKKTEKKVFGVSFYEITITLVLVGSGFYLITGSISKSLLAAIIATATAPVSTLVVLREQAAEGKLTTYIKGMTGINNLIALIAFILLYPLIHSIDFSSSVEILRTKLFISLFTVFASTFCGIILGILMALWEVREHKDANKVFIVFVALLLAISFTKMFYLNELIIFFFMGIAYANSTVKKSELKELVQKVDLPFYVLFFILTGAYLPLREIKTMSIYVAAYVILRTAGKYLGIKLGCQRRKLGDRFNRLLPLTMFSHETIAIGLTAFALSVSGTQLKSFTSVILASIVFFEMMGPVLLKYAVSKSGESPIGNVVSTRGRAPYTSIKEVIKEIFMSIGILKTKQMSIASGLVRDKSALHETADFKRVLKFVEHSPYDAFPVVNEQGYFIGAISYFDIKDVAFDPALIEIVRATDIARSDLYVRIDESIENIVEKFTQNHNAYLPVVEVTDEKPHFIGYLSRRDMMSKYLTAHKK